MLQILISCKEPPWRSIRASKTTMVVYTEGEISVQGFGVLSDDGVNITTTFGEWILLVREVSTSNYKELSNLMERLEANHESRELMNTEMFLVTGSMVAEYGYGEFNK